MKIHDFDRNERRSTVNAIHNIVHNFYGHSNRTRIVLLRYRLNFIHVNRKYRLILKMIYKGTQHFLSLRLFVEFNEDKNQPLGFCSSWRDGLSKSMSILTGRAGSWCLWREDSVSDTVEWAWPGCIGGRGAGRRLKRNQKWIENQAIIWRYERKFGKLRLDATFPSPN